MRDPLDFIGKRVCDVYTLDSIDANEHWDINYDTRPTTNIIIFLKLVFTVYPNDIFPIKVGYYITTTRGKILKYEKRLNLEEYLALIDRLILLNIKYTIFNGFKIIDV